ncbi:MAG TPA: redoxin domain-containing protein [Burkholderiaceae bacterium]|nr:redoxin domain-containing protein [Burkholderiaceae bacterium]
MAIQPLHPGDRAPDFVLPAVNREGEVSLADYRGKRPLLVGLFRGLHCPFCRRQIARLSATQKSLSGVGVDTVAVVNTPLERARLYFRYHPTTIVLAADPDVRTHHAFGLAEAKVLPDDADPNDVHWPETTTMARITESTTLSRPEVQETMSIFAATDTLNRLDAFEATEVDQQIAQAHGFQGTGHFLIDAEGIIRWAFIEAADGEADVCLFPGDDELIAAARAFGHH